mgnify:FL=1
MKIKKITKEHYTGNVFNLGIERHHNYFVNGVLVHNCYQDSMASEDHPNDILEKFEFFFGQMSENEKPFQIAFGGGEPTSHPKFVDLMELCSNMGITPNYTTNGMWVNTPEAKSIMDATVKYCGGVAVSTHPHLKDTWKLAADKFIENGVFTNLHVIIGDRSSIDEFIEVYNEYKGKVKYFVLLPLTAQGRAKESFVDWDY